MLFSLASCGGGENPETSAAGDDSGNTNEITGIVFLDENANGMFDSGESGLAGIVINGAGASATADENGTYVIYTENDSAEISVDASSLEEGYTLTTGNSTQTVTVSGGTGTAEDIGYAESASSGGDNISFSDALDGSDTYDNYYFELELVTGGQAVDSPKIWVMGENMKYETAQQSIFYNYDGGTMGVYTKDANQLVITPIMETVDIETPFTLASEIGSETFNDISYQGTENPGW